MAPYQIFELFLCHLNFQRTHYVTYSSIKQIFIECYHVPHTVLVLRIPQRTKVTKNSCSSGAYIAAEGDKREIK